MPSQSAQRGEVWIVDLGYAGKIRPCLIINIPVQPHERTLISIVPSTTSVAGSRFEVAIKARFLSSKSVFDAQQIGTYPQVRLIPKIGVLTADQLSLIESALQEWLGLV